jgi:hypothetical protein
MQFCYKEKSMADVSDMRGYIETLKQMGELRELTGVDLNLEVGALTERAAEKEGAALLFNNFKGYPSGFRVISNVFRTCRRTGPAMGIAAVIEKARRIVGDGPTYISFDVDGLAPVYAPGTGTPEIGGITTHEAQRLLRGLRPPRGRRCTPRRRDGNGYRRAWI